MVKKRLLSIIVLVVLAPAFLFAQAHKTRQKQPPKARLDLPNILETPDQLRTFGGKLDAAGDSLHVLPLPSSYQPIQLEPDSAVEEIMSEKKAQKRNSFFKYRLGYGSFQNILLDLMRWQKLPMIEFKLQTFYHRNDGQYDQSGIETGTFAGNFNHRFFAQQWIRTKFSYDFRNYELQASPLPSHLKKENHFHIDGKVPFRTSINAGGQVGIDFTRFQLGAENDRAYTERTENTFTAQLNYHWKQINRFFYVDVSFTNNANKIYPDSTSADFISQIKTTFIYKFNNQFSGLVGTQLYNYALENRQSESRLLPFGKLIFAPNDRWGVFAVASRRIEYDNFHFLWEINPYLNLHTPLSVRDIQLQTEVGGDLKLWTDLFLKSCLSYASLRNLRYFRKESYWFNCFSLPEVNTVTVALELDWQFQPGLALNVNSQFIHYQISQAPAFVEDQYHIPYYENVRLTVDFSYDFSPDTQIKITHLLLGPRYTTFTKDKKLSSCLLLNFSLEKTFNEYMTLYLLANNLLNQKYQFWEDYREMGFNILVGLKGIW